jgi:hypothetical protein
MTSQQKQKMAALDQEYAERRAAILAVKPKKPPIMEPFNPKWTLDLIQKLHKYIQENRKYRVEYRGSPIFGMDLVPADQMGDFPPDSAMFYLSDYDDTPPDGPILQDCSPEEFQVFLLEPFNWRQS